MSESRPVLDNVIVSKADSKGKGKGKGKSKQLPQDPFGKLYTEHGLVRPPYNFDKLMELKESNPIHGACIEQKAADIAGLGWKFAAKALLEEGRTPDPRQKAQMEEFIEGCADDLTFREMLQAAWEDFETIGWGILEITRDGTGAPAGLYYAPAATFRAHNDGKRYAQLRDGKLRWFKRAGIEEKYDFESGDKAESIPEEQEAGEVVVFRKVGGRSSYYGIPNYISAIGSIIGSQEARDFNIGWFKEKTIPDVLLIVEGADVGPNAEKELKAFFNVEARGDNSGKLCILPIPGDMVNQVSVKIEKLQSEMKDASFRLYRQDNAQEICVAHRVPPYRIGWPVMGSMGGATAKEMTEIYKRSVVQPAQEILEHRLNLYLFKPYIEIKFENKFDWKWKLEEIDLSDQMADLEYSIKGIEKGVFSRNEARAHLGKDKVEHGDEYYMTSSVVPVSELHAKQEGGEEPEGQDPPGSAPAKPGEKKIPPKGQKGQEVTKEDLAKLMHQVSKILKAAGEDVDPLDAAWEEFEKEHEKREKKLQKTVGNFSEAKQSE